MYILSTRKDWQPVQSLLNRYFDPPQIAYDDKAVEKLAQRYIDGRRENTGAMKDDKLFGYYYIALILDWVELQEQIAKELYKRYPDDSSTIDRLLNIVYPGYMKYERARIAEWDWIHEK